MGGERGEGQEWEGRDKNGKERRQIGGKGGEEQK